MKGQPPKIKGMERKHGQPVGRVPGCTGSVRSSTPYWGVVAQKMTRGLGGGGGGGGDSQGRGG